MSKSGSTVDSYGDDNEGNKYSSTGLDKSKGHDYNTY